MTLDHRFFLCGDAHIRESVPRFRTDDFTAAMLRKLGFIQNKCLTDHGNIVIFPGDVTDSPRLTPRMFYLIITLLKRNRVTHNFGIFGQHDLRYWTNPWESALAVLEAAGAITLLRASDGPWHLGARTGDNTEVYLYGCGWNEDIPQVKETGKNIRNVLIIHRLFAMEGLYPGDDNWADAEGFLKNSNWDLIVAGDNHAHFNLECGGRYFVNCGSLMRSRIDQIHHKPVIYEYLAKSRKLTCIPVPCEEIEVVMDLERAAQDRGREEELEVFVQKIGERTEIEGLDFERNMERRLEEDDITDEMREIWKEVVQDASKRLKNIG